MTGKTEVDNKDLDALFDMCMHAREFEQSFEEDTLGRGEIHDFGPSDAAHGSTNAKFNPMSSELLAGYLSSQRSIFDEIEEAGLDLSTCDPDELDVLPAMQKMSILGDRILKHDWNARVTTSHADEMKAVMSVPAVGICNIPCSTGGRALVIAQSAKDVARFLKSYVKMGQKLDLKGSAFLLPENDHKAVAREIAKFGVKPQLHPLAIESLECMMPSFNVVVDLFALPRLIGPSDYSPGIPCPLLSRYILAISRLTDGKGKYFSIVADPRMALNLGYETKGLGHVVFLEAIYPPSDQWCEGASLTRIGKTALYVDGVVSHGRVDDTLSPLGVYYDVFSPKEFFDMPKYREFIPSKGRSRIAAPDLRLYRIMVWEFSPAVKPFPPLKAIPVAKKHLLTEVPLSDIPITLQSAKDCSKGRVLLGEDLQWYLHRDVLVARKINGVHCKMYVEPMSSQGKATIWVTADEMPPMAISDVKYHGPPMVLTGELVDSPSPVIVMCDVISVAGVENMGFWSRFSIAKRHILSMEGVPIVPQNFVLNPNALEFRCVPPPFEGAQDDGLVLMAPTARHGAFPFGVKDFHVLHGPARYVKVVTYGKYKSVAYATVDFKLSDGSVWEVDWRSLKNSLGVTQSKPPDLSDPAVERKYYEEIISRVNKASKEEVAPYLIRARTDKKEGNMWVNLKIVNESLTFDQVKAFWKSRSVLSAYYVSDFPIKEIVSSLNKLEVLDARQEFELALTFPSPILGGIDTDHMLIRRLYALRHTAMEELVRGDYYQDEIFGMPGSAPIDPDLVTDLNL